MNSIKQVLLSGHIVEPEQNGVIPCKSESPGSCSAIWKIRACIYLDLSSMPTHIGCPFLLLRRTGAGERNRSSSWVSSGRLFVLMLARPAPAAYRAYQVSFMIYLCLLLSLYKKSLNLRFS